ncbi:acetylcholine receptor subunit alpha-L1-like [Saccostrea echinata]|uniref:acetylcholine receptor subunit alpha-L1-like n=1 Tax=Saccostrea echinata TaxID=191078 RepID=UPI002A8419C7|nr:acetylcholine receptor subunit alpha-L1-like [Saccostrea echinata]
MALRDIVEIDEKQQLIRLKIWIRLGWKDCMLQWDPSSYQNKTELVVPYSRIWIPDITLYEGVSDEGNMPHMDVYRASIKHTGNVMYMYPSIVTIACKFNVAYFPFDHQMCSMKIGSWIYSAKNIEMKSIREDVDISSFRTHNEWDIVGTAAVTHNAHYGCCPDPSPEEHDISPLIYSIFLDKCRKMMCIKFENVLKPVKQVCSRVDEGKTAECTEKICFEKHSRWKCSKLSSENELPECSFDEIPECSFEIKQQSIHHDRHKCHVTNEWELIACVLDRLFMFIYICLSMINSIAFFIIMWNYEEEDIPID